MVPDEIPILADTHCHLDFNAFNTDRDQVIERARLSGLKRMLNPGIDIASSQAAVRLAQSIPEVYAAVGIHPNESTSYELGSIEDLRNLASLDGKCSGSKVVAIGEIGLDYYRDWAPHELQRTVLQDHLKLAAELELPVIIHNRQAANDLLPILSDWHAELITRGSALIEHAGTLHSFSDTVGTALKAIELGFYIGFTGPVTFRNAAQLQEVVAELPEERLLIETDAPFLAPHPHRGQRNEPAYVSLVAQKLASIKQVSYAKMAEIAWTNAGRLFGW